MDSRSIDGDEQSTAGNTPEDVAVLYSWANLQGAKYRDYSASRREYRAQVRYRAARADLDQELQAKSRADASTPQAADVRARFEPGSQANPQTTSATYTEDPERRAVQQRVEVAQRAEAAARLTVLALREEREVAEAHSSARRQALAYDEAELQRRQLAGPQPFAAPSERNSRNTPWNPGLEGDGSKDPQQLSISGWPTPARPMFANDFLPPPPRPASASLPEIDARPEASSHRELSEIESFEESGAPAWLFATQPGVRGQADLPTPASRTSQSTDHTLLDSRQRVAARWYALRGAFEYAAAERTATPRAQAGPAQVPLVVLFSLAGGVGKTSLAATLSRALAVQGETVALVDTTAHGLLPVYFGWKDARSEAAPEARVRAKVFGTPISLAIHNIADRPGDERQREAAVEALLNSGEGKQRLLLDVATGAGWLVRRLIDRQPIVLVPVAPDMNSVISLQAVECMFQDMAGSAGRPLLPFYVLNQFDASLPLHLDIREVFRRQLGDRLLRVSIRRSQSVSEALADGMTVLDYAPDAPVAEEYREIAHWLRGVSPPATGEVPSVRWGEP